MVVSGNVEKYEELRALHNSVVDIDVSRAPPFEEYRGMSSICGNIFCMWVLCGFVSCRVPRELFVSCCRCVETCARGHGPVHVVVATRIVSILATRKHHVIVHVILFAWSWAV